MQLVVPASSALFACWLGAGVGPPVAMVVLHHAEREGHLLPPSLGRDGGGHRRRCQRRRR